MKLFYVLSLVLLATQVPASTIRPIDAATLYKEAPIIVIGKVSSVSPSDSSPDRQNAAVQILEVMKGKADKKTIALKLATQGLVDFDPKLQKNQIGIFFLKQDPDNSFSLFNFGTVAIFEKDHIR